MSPAGRPNFLIVVADQLRADAVGTFGSAVARTPNLDALAERGTRFSNAFVQHTVCSPSRASFLTGWYPHTRGHRSLTHLLGPDDPNLLKTLKGAGYHVTHVGLRGDTWAPGGTEASCHEYGWLTPPPRLVGGAMAGLDPDDPMTRAFYVGLVDDEADHDFDEACVRTAEAWFDRRDQAEGGATADQPWVLYVPMLFPHCPFAVAEPWYSLHDRDAMPARRPSMASGHEPAYMQHLRDDYGTARLSEDQWREIAAVYHGMVSRFDHHLGRMLSALERSGAADDTVVIVFSDHGEYLGDYDLIEKWPSGLHDCLARDPLLMAGPGIPSGRAVEAMVELVDLVPTVHELAGVEADYTHFGRSLLPVMADPTTGHRSHAFTEGGFLIGERNLLEQPGFPYDLKGLAQRERPETVGKAVAVRSPDWTYVRRLYEPPELYDRRTDPDEIVNLAGRPDAAAVEAELDGEILRWLLATGDVLPWEPHPRFPSVELPAPGG